MKKQIEALIQQRREISWSNGNDNIAVLKKPLGRRFPEAAVYQIILSDCEQYIWLHTEKYNKKIKSTKLFDYIYQEF